MNKQWRWLMSCGLLWGLLAVPQLIWAQMPLNKVSCQIEKLNEQELQQLHGQGSVMPAVQITKPVYGIKLWDEWARPQNQGLSGTTGQNQVVTTMSPR